MGENITYKLFFALRTTVMRYGHQSDNPSFYGSRELDKMSSTNQTTKTKPMTGDMKKKKSGKAARQIGEVDVAPGEVGRQVGRTVAVHWRRSMWLGQS